MHCTATEPPSGGDKTKRLPVADVLRQPAPYAGLPVTRDPMLAHALSLLVALLAAGVSVAGLIFGPAGLYGGDTGAAHSVALVGR